MEKQKKFFKTKMHRYVLSLCMILTLTCNAVNVSAAEIIRPVRNDPNAAVYHKGVTTYYNPDNQKWQSMTGSMLYSYKAKKDIKYYKPIFFIGAWVDNNGKDLTVEIGSGYSKSVEKAVSGTLGITAEKKMVELATSISGSYSSTVSYSNDFSMIHIFDLKKFPKNYKYKPALFGEILQFFTVKTNRVTKKESFHGYAYTFNDSNDLELKLAFK